MAIFRQKKLSRAMLALACVSAVSVAAFGAGAQDAPQRPRSPFANPQNLQVLPPDISPEGLRDVMRNFTFATGLRCSDCHVAVEGAPLADWDFQSDEMPRKRIAREMMLMVGRINASISEIPDVAAQDGDAVRVRCVTCHRGVAQPQLIQDVLDEYRATGDGAGAVTHYQDLRESYYGSHSYDFSAATLARYAEEAGSAGQAEFAMELHRLNVMLNADSADAHGAMGNTLMAMENFAAAATAFGRAVELDPDNQFRQQLLRRANEQAAGVQ